jgi:hypothetical protein
MTAKEFDNFRIKTLENQKFNADTISVSLSKKELELLIDKLSDMPITNKQAINIYQKLTEKLETLENKNEIR